MATLTLNYDAQNSLATKTIEYIMSLGVFSAVKKEKISGIDEALEDVKKGRVYKADSVKDMFEQLERQA